MLKISSKHFWILSIFCCLFFNIEAQNIVLNEELVLSQMINKYAEQNKTKKVSEGWRIQIAATTDRRQVEEVIAAFNFKYPDVVADWFHVKPYYKIQVGAFASRADALKLFAALKKEYIGALIIANDAIPNSHFVGLK